MLSQIAPGHKQQSGKSQTNRGNNLNPKKIKKTVDKENSVELASFEILIEDKNILIMNTEITNNSLETWSGWWWLCGNKMC